ncbi:M24 family metallopeptidase [Nakamurella lactea]|uniref:M24 family metallopeptidase n=1 Tax=Nakamurella lactea TaxID=459515 RepID=UPI0003FD1E99|nr:aminopeptidase P family protein [Nakamurella lactea]
MSVTTTSTAAISAAAAADDALRTPTDVATLADRLGRLADQAGRIGADAILIAPGADMRYFVGHSVGSHERFSCLAVTPDGRARLLVPLLERPGWAGTPVERLDLQISTWKDGEDPYSALTALLPAGVTGLAVDDYLPAMHAIGMRDALPGSRLALVGAAIGELRMRKDAAEVAALAAVGAAIDRVQRRIGEWLRPGRTEHEVAADITEALVQEGHSGADFVIVGSGPNGASPHHEASDRVIQQGDPVVIDIGGPSPAGYFSDCTRTYSVGAPADPEFGRVYEIVRTAQAAGVAAAVAGATCASADAAARTVIERAGYGEYFVTRTGHGIGLEVHEHPYLVAGNEQPLEPGMTFSVEPGIYLPGRFGVRIEDIVVVDEAGAPRLLNNCPTELTIVGDGTE